MPILDLADIPAHLSYGQRLMGLDIGEKTIGLAVADPLHQIASPLPVIERRKFTQDAAAIAALCTGRDVGALIIGLPLNMDGTEGPRCQSIRQFARNITQHPGLFTTEPYMAFWDERLSTAAMQRMMIDEMDMTRKKRSQKIDSLAAQWILQGALDYLNG